MALPLSLTLAGCLALAGFVPAQPAASRPQVKVPKTVKEALEDYEADKDKLPTLRGRSILNLGRFQDPRVTRILLDELASVGQQNLRRTVVQALGQKPREGALAELIEVFEASTTSYLVRRAAAPGIARQGDAGVDYLLKKYQELGPPKPSVKGNIRSSKRPKVRVNPTAALRTAVITGLGAAKSERVSNLLAEEAMRGSDYSRYQVLQQLRKAMPTPKLTEARLEAAGSRYIALAVQGVLQLAEQGHDQAKVLTLELLKRNKNKRLSSIYMAPLVEALAAILDQDTYEAFLLAAAAAGSRAKAHVEKLRKNIDAHPNLVDWLLDKGLVLDNVHARLIAVQLLSSSTDKRVTARFGKLALGKEPGLARKAIQALGKRGDKAAIGTLRQVLRGGHAGRKLDAVHSLHALSKDNARWKSDLIAMLDGNNDDQKALALDLLASYQDKTLLPKVYRELRNKSWPVRAAAMDFCRQVRDKDSIPYLIERLAKEKGRLFADCQLALKAHTGFRLHTVEKWRDWWRDKETTFVLPPLAVVQEKESRGPIRASTATISYFNIPLVSDRVIFLLDTSGSMSAPMGGVRRSSPSTGSGKGGKRSTAPTRLEEAKVQLKRVITALPEDARFNLIYFDTPVNTFLARMVFAKKGMKQKAIGSVQGLQPRGGTNIHDALEEAFTDQAVDTIYLLSDGAPSAGKITNADEIAQVVAIWNRTRRIRIHTISLGSKSALMERLAKDSGGQHVWVQ